ncbi:HAMP domain-containing protein [Methanoculleus sp. Wushi-C6]|uniref:histidine kinase n=1 Tax=Methanoculleus caldifontis TaxID=2651577 RepID=A0ABU3WYT3_9EURY|nr:HAMP domain-containing protein [Methanoculleus sp. Wushi-C6]MDV2480958.1 HAMP domain-containing protein [Methanoculleus sp. Wushi-C6]
MYTYGETKNALKETTQDELRGLASIIATQIDGDAMAALRPGDEETPAFVAIRHQLETIRQSNPDILYLYTMRQAGDTVEFIVDADYGVEDGAAIGEVYDRVFPELLAGFTAPSVDSEFTTDGWGTVLSGYAPVRDSSGTVVGLVGVDMDSSRVMQRQDFIGNTIFVIIGIAVLIAGGIIALFSRTIIRDIKTLNATANAISTGNTGVTIGIERRDEIGELADSFGRMVASLKIMMDTDAGEK